MWSDKLAVKLLKIILGKATFKKVLSINILELIFSVQVAVYEEKINELFSWWMDLEV